MLARTRRRDPLDDVWSWVEIQAAELLKLAKEGRSGGDSQQAARVAGSLERTAAALKARLVEGEQQRLI